MYGSGIFILLLLNFGAAEAIAEGGLCYILDGVLILYGIVLTILYCRLRMRSGNNEKNEENPDGIYQGLKHKNQDTYETLHMKKQPLA
ncbi:Fc receptor, IgE, high affinity I, gamma polypeptide like [Ictalurus furcatus]|uniref:Fc receptor, IgE, high affinity I, gamma polypeptide like n=1 Tax=Ictalurus furcatus TaxID=66913 RepID=UPI002350DE8B|nr:Fc receptor, IgE, high affinity I, gamma polypeptide like [Ictalurus furcatus]